MSLQGPNNGGTFADDSGTGSVAWSNPGNAQYPDGVSATVGLNTTNTPSHYLDVTNFGLSVPSSAVIQGIQVDVLRKCGAGNVQDNRVRLIKAGSVQANQDKAVLGTAWPTSLTYQTYGSGTDLWNNTWAPADVNATNFGVALGALGTNATTDTASIDHVRLSVYYTASKDLITLGRAYSALQGVSGVDSLLSALVTAYSEAIEKYCRRRFVSAAYDELYDGTGDRRLFLRQYPIQKVTSVRYRPVTVVKVTNSNTFLNQQARAQVTSTGLQLWRMASGTAVTETLLTWASYPTLQALANAVSALGNGWSAQIVGDSAPTGDYGLWPSADLYLPGSYGDTLEGSGVLQSQGALTCRGTNAELKLHTYEVSGYQWDARGWLLRAIPYTDPELVHPEDLVWPVGVNNFRIQYTAGYTTVPEAVQEACAQWVAEAYYSTQRDPSLLRQDVPSSIAQTWAAAGGVPHPPARVRRLLAPYRRHTVATDQA